MNILGINAHEKTVSGCRIEISDNKIIVHQNYLWALQQLEHIPYIIEQLAIDFDIRRICFIQHERTKNIIEYLRTRQLIKILEISESVFKNKTSLVQSITEKIVSKDIVFSNSAWQVEEFFKEFSDNASFSNILEKNEYETSYVWAFILACSVVPLFKN